MNNNCQIFTPTHIAQEMLDLIDYRRDILEKYILDNSCGNGSLLAEAVKRYISDAKSRKKSKKQISNELSTYIIGIDVDESLVNECKSKLTAIAKENDICNVNWQIKKADGLKYNFDVKFDFIVGNPPYIAYAMLDKEVREYVKSNFQSCTYGKFDYSYAFVEKCLDLLNNDGKMVFITPSNMFKTQFGKKIREIMLPYITKIVDYSFEKVFEKVLTSPAITVFDKNAGNSLLYELKNAESSNTKELQKIDLKEKWYFFNNELSGKKTFGNYFKVSNSVATLCNEVFVVNESTIARYNIEKDSLKVAKSPKSQKYNKNEYIIFPYKYVDGQLERYEETEYKNLFPNTYNYLLQFKHKLQETNKDATAKWFEYGRSQALAHLNQPKLLISTIATHQIIVYKLDKNEIPYSGLYIVPISDLELDKAQQVLTQESTMNVLKASGVVLSGTSVRIGAKDISNLKF